MVKAILVNMPDIPKNCRSCPLNGYYCEYSIVCRHYQTGDTRPSLCPLRPLPEKKETCSVIDYASGKAMIDEYENEFNLGWNACLKEITGETE